MHKTITTTLLILASGLTLNVAAVAEPFNHGSAYVNYRNYDEGPESLAEFRKRQSDIHSSANVQFSKIGGFNDRGTVESENVVVDSRTAIETPLSKMLSITGNGFNDRG